jgi:hypothetical protein
MEVDETSMLKSNTMDAGQTPTISRPTNLTLFVTSILPCSPDDQQCMLTVLTQMLVFMLAFVLVCFCMNYCSCFKLKRARQNRRTYGARRRPSDNVVEAFELRPLQPIQLTTFATVSETSRMPVPPPLPPISPTIVHIAEPPLPSYEEAATSSPTADMLIAAKSKLKPVVKK